MPKSKYKGRGKILGYRTLDLPKGEYAHLAIVSKKGKKGGTTILGKIRTKRK